MIDWASLSFANVWPLWLGILIAGLLTALWYFHHRAFFPDITLITKTVRSKGIMDRLPFILGAVVLLLLVLVLMEPSVIRTTVIEQQARDFLVIVDTSRSMRHDTDIRRDSIDLHYERRVGAFNTEVDDPRKMPYLARYELARESLLSFLAQRKGQDRVGMIYFNDDAYTMSSPTTNIEFVINQLASMDDYVNWGTDIATAVDSGLNLLERYPEQNRRTLILLTDAESRYTQEVEQQLSRLAGKEMSFYLLWITTDENDLSDEEIASFLNHVKTIGKIVTIRDLDTRNLKNALLEISRLEGYTYEEVKRQRLDLSLPVMKVTLWILLIWLFLVATFFHPTTNRNTFEGSSL